MPAGPGSIAARRRPTAAAAGPALRRLLGALAMCALLPQPCLAIDWLVLVVDRSMSVDDRELALQRSAYIRLLSEPGVIGALGGAQVAIVEFDTSSQIVVDWTDAGSAAAAYRRKPPDGLRGQTGIGIALTTALALLVGKSGRRVIDVSGDGRENVDHLRLAQARATADAQAIEINGLAILNDEVPDLDRYYSTSVVNGFVLSVERRDDFAAALKRKLFYEVAGLQPPARTVALHAP
jgi:hypothetical protein